MTFAIILSGGTGSRLGADIPKQYIEVEGRKIISYTLDKIISSDKIDAIVIVADPAYWEMIKSDAADFAGDGSEGIKPMIFAYPGATRQLSILSGMLRIEDFKLESGLKLGLSKENSSDYVFIHDAARPNLGSRTIDSCMEAVEGHDGVLPSLPMKDTVYMSADGGKSISSLLDRSQIFAGQAPEVFALDKYLDANIRLIAGDLLRDDKGVLSPDKSSPIYRINGSTEPAIMAGMDIVMIPGDENNFKITTRSDLDRFEEVIRSR